MSNTIFLITLAVLTVVMIAVMHKVVGLIADEFREGHRTTGFAMIAAVITIVAAALPWWML